VLFIFSFTGDLKPVYKTALVLLFLITGISTLVYNRQFYKTFYIAGNEMIVEKSVKFQDQNPTSKTTSILVMEKDIFDFYRERHDQKNKTRLILFDQNSNFQDLNFILKDSSIQQISIGWAEKKSQVLRSAIENIFPWMLNRELCHLGHFYSYSKFRADSSVDIPEDKIVFEQLNDFESPFVYWDPVPSPNISKEFSYSQDNSMKIDSTVLYSPGFKTGIYKIINHPNNTIFISTEVYTGKIKTGAHLVAIIESKTDILKWKSSEIDQFLIHPNNWNKVFLELDLSDVKIKDKHATFITYIWNPDRSELFIDDYKVSVREGNKLFYGVFQDL
ncbi:MAG: hypothetical protein K8R53_04850, partial [Bacteroidales bacterium]|nr:hypothetical protein [Bacteroidales bacterium]